MATKTMILEVLQRAQQDRDAFVMRLSPVERQASGTPDHWAPKDTLAHLAAWCERLAQRLRDSTTPPVADFNQQNDAFFQAHRHQSLEEILVYSQRVYGELTAIVDSLAEAELQDTQRFPVDEAPLWQRFVGAAYTHPLTHYSLHDIARGDIELANRLHEQALEWLSPLDDSPRWRGNLLYNLACQYALAGARSQALQRLREALALAPGLVEWSKQDSDLASLREHPDYWALYE